MKTEQYELRSPNDKMKLIQVWIKSPNDKLKNVCKLKNIGDSDLALFVWTGPLQMHLCIKYEGSMIQTGESVKEKKEKKNGYLVPFKK